MEISDALWQNCEGSALRVRHHRQARSFAPRFLAIVTAASPLKTSK